MQANPTTPLQCHLNGELQGAPDVFVVDAAGFPFMPAQNPTMIAVANALRIATTARIAV